MRRPPPALATCVAWVALVLASPATATPPAGAEAAAPHRAAVIVDTGTQVKTVCVRFAEESISGVEALRRAGVDPVLRPFAGKGAAVCALCGTGCDAGESCLTCDPGGRFWGYSRAVAGAGALQPSGLGASSTSVRDGDVEGWRWGLGETPALVPLAQVCVEAPAPPGAGAGTTTPPAAPTVPPGPPGVATTIRAPSAPAPGSGAPATTAAAPPGPTPPPAAPDAARAPTTAAPGPVAAAPDAGPAARTGRDDEGGRGWAGLLAPATALAALVTWAAVTRRRRKGGPDGVA